MIVARIYAVGWLLLLSLAAVLFFTGTFTSAAVVAVGFIASVLTGAGMLVVYPVLMNEDLRLQRTPAVNGQVQGDVRGTGSR